MATGDICIRRVSTGGTNYNSASYTDVTFDTSVRQDGIYSVSGAEVNLSDAGHYLVTYNVATYSDAGTNRSETTARLTINNAGTSYGISSGYIRRSGGADEFVQSATTILSVSAGDDVGVEVARTDSNTVDASVALEANMSGLSFIKLPDSFAYARLRKTSSQTLSVAGQTPPVSGSSFNYVDVTWDTQDELDSGYSHSTSTNADEVTLSAAGMYLVCYQCRFNNASATARYNAIARLALDGSVVRGSYSTAYARGTNNVQNPVASSAMVVSATAGQVLTLQAAVDSEQTITSNMTVSDAAITVIKLATSNGIARLRQSADHDHNTSSFDPISFDTQDTLDTSIWSHSTSVNPSRLTRQRGTGSKDHLILGGFWQVRNAVSSIRKNPEIRFREDGTTLLTRGGAIAHDRGDQSTSGCWTGGAGSALVWPVNISSTHYIELGGLDRASTTDASTEWEGGDTFLHGLDIDTVFDEGQEVSVTSITSDESFGVPDITLYVEPVGILTGERFGIPPEVTLYVDLDGSGIISGARYGVPDVEPGPIDIDLTGDGITTGFRAGEPGLKLYIDLTGDGLVSDFAAGTPTISIPLEIDLGGEGILSAEGFGTPTIEPGNIDAAATSIASDFAAGTPTIDAGGTYVFVTRIAGGEAFGSLTIEPGPVDEPATGIVSGFRPGVPSFEFEGYTLDMTGLGLSSEFAAGAVTIDTSTVYEYPTSIGSEFGAGTPTVTPGGIDIDVTSLTFTGRYGVPQFEPGNLDVFVPVIHLGETIGEPGTVQSVTITGAPSAFRAGLPTVVPGESTVDLTDEGIASGEAVGTPSLVEGGYYLDVTSIEHGGGAIGEPTIDFGEVTVSAIELDSEFVAGEPTFEYGNVDLLITSLTYDGRVGNPSLSEGDVSVQIDEGITTGFRAGEPSFDFGEVTVTVPEGFEGYTEGGATLVPGEVTLDPPTIISGESFGTATATPGGYDLDITSITYEGDQIGSPEIEPRLDVDITSIGSGEGIGSPTVTPGELDVPITGIPSAGRFGSPSLSQGDISITMYSIDWDGDLIGTPTVTTDTPPVSPPGSRSELEFGRPRIVPGPVEVPPTSIDPPVTQFGAPSIGRRVTIESLGDLLYIGTPIVSNNDSGVVIRVDGDRFDDTGVVVHPEADEYAKVINVVHVVNYYADTIGWNDGGGGSSPSSYDPPLIISPPTRADGSTV